MKISASSVESFAGGTHNLRQHIREGERVLVVHGGDAAVWQWLSCAAWRRFLQHRLKAGTLPRPLSDIACPCCPEMLFCPWTSASLSFHPLGPPSPSRLAVFMLWLSTGLFSSQCGSMSSAPRHHSCSMSFFSPQFLQHRLERAWLVKGGIFSLPVFVFRKPFCNIDLN